MLYYVVYLVCVQYLVPETCRLREIEWQNFSGTKKIENPTEFLYEMLHNFLAGKASKTTLFNFLPKVLPGETLCKLVQIFPPKVLVYIRKWKIIVVCVYWIALSEIQ